MSDERYFCSDWMCVESRLISMHIFPFPGHCSHCEAEVNLAVALEKFLILLPSSILPRSLLLCLTFIFL